MSLKEYTELNKTKHQIWADFCWTLKDLTDNGKAMNIGDIINVMTIREKAEKLIDDYWATAKSESKKWGVNWNNLDYEKRQRLVNYWGQKKWQEENGKIQELERQVEQGQRWEREITQMVDIRVFHEERGKIKCVCQHCKDLKELEAEKKKEWREYLEQEKKKAKKEKAEEYTRGECAECYEEKRVSIESGLCKKCEKEAEEGYGEEG